MFVIKIHQLSGQKKGLCYLPEKIFTDFKLKDNKDYGLKCGQKEVKVFLKAHDKAEDVLYLSGEVIKQLHVIPNQSITFWKEDHLLQLGPVLGVFLNTKYIAEIEAIRSVSFLHNHMVAANATHCMTYFFSINHIDWINKKIKGYWLDLDKNEWKQQPFPFPDVLYDRGATFDPEQKLLVKHIREQFRSDPTITFINSKDYLGKWQLAKRLAKHSTIQPYLPETIEYKEFNDVLTMMNKHGFIFIKSFYGSRGREVMSIEKQADNYVVVYYDDGLVRKVFKEIEEIKALVQQYTEEKRFVVQRGINVVKYNDCHFDTRVLMHKNGVGNWSVSYNRVSIAKKDASITTINSSELIEYHDFYEKMKMKTNNFPTDDEVRKVSIDIAHCIDAEFGSFAEIGMDIIIDEQGRIWFIEANSKPEKYPGATFQYSDVAEIPFISIFEYTKYLLQIKPHTISKSTEMKMAFSNDLEKNHISVPSGLVKNLKNDKEIVVKVGMSKAKVMVKENDSNDQVFFSEQLFHHFGFIENAEYQIDLDADEQQIRIGPVIAIFLSNGNIRKMHRQTPKFRHKEFALANQQAKTMLYFFSVKDVDFINKQIYGTYYHEKRQHWERKAFPFPDVFYDRGGGVLPKQVVKSDYIRDQLRKCLEIKTFNHQHYFDKWDLYEKLKQFDEMLPFLPTSKLLKNPDDLKAMYNISTKLYIKDCFGNNGRGVCYVEKLSNGKYEYRFFNRNVTAKQVDSIEEVAAAINEFLPDKKMLIQEAIPLIKVNERNIDLRATLQRDKHGDLQIIAYPIRMGVSKSPITSTQSGSKVFQFEQFFAEYFNYPKSEIDELKEKVERFLITCFKCTEKAYGTFAELGIDFALDENLDLWLIECNAKPGHDAMYNSYGRETIEKAFLNPLEYCKLLSEF